MSVHGWSADPNRSLWGAKALLVSCVLLQRLAVPAGGTQVPVVLLITYASLAWLAATGALRHRKPRLELFVVALVACLAVTAGTALSGRQLSLTSSIYLLVAWLPFVWCLRQDLQQRVDDVLGAFLGVMLVVSVLAVVQVLFQAVGWGFPDPLAALPEPFVLEGFMTTYPAVWTSAVHKANGMVMLEPSFLSQFCALAFVIGTIQGRPAALRILYCLGLAASLSGTGLLLLGVGMAWLWVHGWPGLSRTALIVAASLGAVGVLTPAGALMADRLDELARPGTSGNLRFVTPYREVVRAADADPEIYVLGAGPGMSERMLESSRMGGGRPVVYPIPAKLVFEYGLVAGGLFAAFIVFCLATGARTSVLTVCLGVMLFALSGSLLQPHVVSLVWVLVSFDRVEVRGPAGRSPHPTDPIGAGPWKGLSSIPAR
jgi:hypothetical protein